MTDSRGTTTYERDALGRLTTTTAPDGGVQRWTYDAAGRPVQTTAVDGAVTTATYDAAGRLTSQSRAGWGTASWQLDADGLVVREDLPGGQYRTYAYDGAGDLARWNQRVGLTSSGVTIGRDADGRITSTKTIGGLSTGSATYRYDAAGQLTSASVRNLDLLTPAQQTWTYDAVGNRATSTADGVRSSYSYDAGHQLTAATTRGVRTSYTYDEAGRRTGEATLNTATTYTYDTAGHPTTLGHHPVVRRRGHTVLDGDDGHRHVHDPARGRDRLTGGVGAGPRGGGGATRCATTGCGDCPGRERFPHLRPRAAHRRALDVIWPSPPHVKTRDTASRPRRTPPAVAPVSGTIRRIVQKVDRIDRHRKSGQNGQSNAMRCPAHDAGHTMNPSPFPADSR